MARYRVNAHFSQPIDRPQAMHDDHRLRFDNPHPSANPPASAWLGKVLAIVLGAAAVTVGVLFSLLALGLLLIAGVVVFAIIHWKMRQWRRQWQAQSRAQNRASASRPANPPEETAPGTIIEGEVLHRSPDSR